MLARIFLILSLIAFLNVSYAGAYRCVQPNGETHYQQTPCEGQATGHALQLESGPSASELYAAEQRAQRMIQKATIPEPDKNPDQYGMLDETGSSGTRSNIDAAKLKDLRDEIKRIEKKIGSFDPTFGSNQRRKWTRERIAELKQELRFKRSEYSRLSGEPLLPDPFAEDENRRVSRSDSDDSEPEPPQWLHDPFSGTSMPRTGAGYTDPRTGTFYHDTGAGVVNTRTGQFIPTN